MNTQNSRQKLPNPEIRCLNCNKTGHPYKYCNEKIDLNRVKQNYELLRINRKKNFSLNYNQLSNEDLKVLFHEFYHNPKLVNENEVLVNSTLTLNASNSSSNREQVEELLQKYSTP